MTMTNDESFIVSFAKLIKDCYLQYMEQTNEYRVFADAEGFKVVHRRILHAMDQLGLGPESNHKKSARVVGDVLGKYHPHGDKSVYDAMIRMGQSWSMRYPLLDIQGNNGNIDGDSPAAMRYTESRLTPIGYEALRYSEYAPEQSTYDNENTEPKYLGTFIPFLLVNGTKGLGVGMRADIPAHNLTEVMNGLIAYVQSEDPDLDILLDSIQGPDLPTGGVIPDDSESIRSVYEDGSGALTHRADFTTERIDGQRALVITEVPMNVSPENVVDSIDKLIDRQTDPKYDDPFDGSTRDVIKDVHNKSDESVRIEVHLRRGENPNHVMSVLFDETKLQRRLAHPAVQFRFLNKNGIPELFSLEETVQRIIRHHHRVLIQEYEQKAANIRSDLTRLRAYAEVLSDHETFLDILGSSENHQHARNQLQEEFDLTDDGLDRVLDLPVRRVTQKDRDEILDKLEDKEQTLHEYEEMLDDKSARTDELIDRYETIRDRFGDERRTTIGDSFSVSDPSETDDSLMVGMNDARLIRIPKASWSRFRSKEKERTIQSVNRIQTDQDVLIIDENERTYQVPGDYFLDSTMHLDELKTVNDNPDLVGVVPIPRDRSGHILVIQSDALVRITDLDEYGDPKPRGKIGHSFMDGTIIGMDWVPDDAEGSIVLMNDHRHVLRMDLDQFYGQSRQASGYKSMNIPDGGRVVAGRFIPNDELEETQAGFLTRENRVKRFDLSEIRSQGRNTKGKTVGPTSMNDDPIMAGAFFRPDEPVFGLQGNTVNRLSPEDFPERSRMSNPADPEDSWKEYDRLIGAHPPLRLRGDES